MNQNEIFSILIFISNCLLAGLSIIFLLRSVYNGELLKANNLIFLAITIYSLSGLYYSQVKIKEQGIISPTKTADPLLKENYNGVRFLKDIRTIDLRSSKSYSKEDKKKKEISPTRITRYMHTMVNDDGKRDKVRFEFSTSGYSIDISSLTHPDSRLLKYENNEVFLIGKEKKEINTYQLEVPLLKEQVNRDFLIITEAVYWNAFSIENEEEDISMQVLAESESTALIILFPYFMEVTGFKLFYVPLTGNKEDVKYIENENDPELENIQSNWPLLRQIKIKQEVGSTFFWRIYKPKRGFQYGVKWKWKKI